MASIADIPKHLWSPAKKGEFMGWLKTLSIQDWTKRDLIRSWCAATKVPFEVFDYIKVGL